MTGSTITLSQHAQRKLGGIGGRGPGLAILLRASLKVDIDMLLRLAWLPADGLLGVNLLELDKLLLLPHRLREKFVEFDKLLLLPHRL